MRMSLASQVGLAVLGSIVPDGQGVGRVGQATLRPLQVDASSLAAPSAAALLPIHLHACCISPLSNWLDTRPSWSWHGLFWIASGPR